MSLETSASEADLTSQTLRFDKIPLVESLGLRVTDSDPKKAVPAKSDSLPAVAPAGTVFTPKDGQSGPLTVATASVLPVGTSVELKPRLLVIRGEKLECQYPIYPGKNYLGRTDEKPVDIDLENQEPPDRIWTSRQHAVIMLEGGTLTIEDLNSLNGTFVNRTRVHPGQLRTLQVNDIIQVGTVQMRLLLG
ncbi:MAG: FHA domain-containing protein [Planctomycetes bacterium]|nr:FHA domain-containing protein [Planctomycetota bacterium]